MHLFLSKHLFEDHKSLDLKRLNNIQKCHSSTKVDHCAIGGLSLWVTIVKCILITFSTLILRDRHWWENDYRCQILLSHWVLSKVWMCFDITSKRGVKARMFGKWCMELSCSPMWQTYWRQWINTMTQWMSNPNSACQRKISSASIHF